MKKIAMFTVMLLVFAGMVWANDVPQPINNNSYIPQEAPEHLKVATQARDNYEVPEWAFVQEPTTLTGFTNYYDYMPGSYCGRPLVAQPDSGVYFVFHGRPNTTDNRRVYWAYVYPSGSIEYGTITTSDTNQGYPSMTIHPASGDPIASWHDVMGSSTPEDTNTRLSYDDYALLGIPGFWKTPVTFDQPEPYVDEYIWPYVYIGMAPDYETTGNYRVYQISCQNPDGEIEHDILRWIDVPQDTWEYGNLAIMLDKTNWSDPVNISRDWSDPDAGIDCRPYPSFAVDPFTPGHVAIFGYAAFTNSDGLTGNEIVPPGYYVWDSYDGGETWSYDNFHSYETDVGMLNEYVLYAVKNIPGFTVDDVLVDSLHVWIGWPGNQHSTHRTAAFDGEGNLHLPEMFWICSVDSEAGEAAYWPYYEFQYETEVVYKADGTWEIREVPELPGVDPWSGHTVPWEIDSGDTLVYPWRDYPFSIDYDVGFHENTQRNAVNLENNWMVQVWDSGTKTLYAEDGISGYDAYATHPIFHVSASPDNGEQWSEPIELSDIYSTVYPGFADMITMYPYINPTIKDLGGGWGQIDMFFLNDNAYGSSIQGIGATTGGEMVYCSFKINFGGMVSVDPSHPNTEASLTLRNVPNPFFSHTQIQFSASVGVENAKVTIYNTKGQFVKSLDATADSHTAGHATWDGTDQYGHEVANGIYFYKVETNGATIAKKMMLSR